MKATKEFKISEELLSKIISAAYGDAGIKDKLIVRRHSKKHEEVRKTFEEYRAIASEVHMIKDNVCPEKLIQNLPGNYEVHNEKRKSFSSDFYSMIFSKPFISATVSLVLIAAIVFGIFNNRPLQYQHNYSQAEIQFAEKQAEQAFAIVGKIFNETSSTLTNEVLESRVARPFGESAGIVNNLINKGEIK